MSEQRQSLVLAPEWSGRAAVPPWPRPWGASLARRTYLLGWRGGEVMASRRQFDNNLPTSAGEPNLPNGDGRSPADQQTQKSIPHRWSAPALPFCIGLLIPVSLRQINPASAAKAVAPIPDRPGYTCRVRVRASCALPPRRAGPPPSSLVLDLPARAAPSAASSAPAPRSTRSAIH